MPLAQANIPLKCFEFFRSIFIKYYIYLLYMNFALNYVGTQFMLNYIVIFMMCR